MFNNIMIFKVALSVGQDNQGNDPPSCTYTVNERFDHKKMNLIRPNKHGGRKNNAPREIFK